LTVTRQSTDARSLRRVDRLVLVRALDAPEFLAVVERTGEMFTGTCRRR
jgi:hypothetical protein